MCIPINHVVSLANTSLDEEMVPYSSKAAYLSRSQMSSNCSTTGSSSSRGSTGSRGLHSGRKHNEVGAMLTISSFHQSYILSIF